MKRLAKLMVIVATLLVCLAAPARAELVWDVQTVDSADNVGYYTSLALDAGGYPHISYLDGTNGDLKYARWDGSSWSTPTVDSVGYVGRYTSLALDGSGYAHISYEDETNRDLKYAAWNGLSWDIETVHGGSDYVADGTALALDSNERPHISYADRSTGRLGYARWSGTSWLREQSGDYNVGWYVSMALDADDYPHISYHERGPTMDHLKYKYRDEAGWHTTYVDYHGNTRVGRFTSIALDTDQYPRISYYDVTESALKYAAWDGSDWAIYTVDSAGNVGEYTSLALDAHGRPHISYFDRTNCALKHAAWDGSDWTIYTVDVVGDDWLHTSLALDAHGWPHISYYDRTTGDLKYAVGTPEPATCILALLGLGFGGLYARRRRRKEAD